MADKNPVSQSQKPVQAHPQAKGDKPTPKAEGKPAGKAKPHGKQAQEAEEICEAGGATAHGQQQK